MKLWFLFIWLLPIHTWNLLRSLRTHPDLQSLILKTTSSVYLFTLILDTFLLWMAWPRNQWDSTEYLDCPSSGILGHPTTVWQCLSKGTKGTKIRDGDIITICRLPLYLQPLEGSLGPKHCTGPRFPGLPPESPISSQRVIYLGHVLSAGKCTITAWCKEAILHLPPPHAKKQLRTFLRRAGFYRIWIQGLVSWQNHRVKPWRDQTQKLWIQWAIYEGHLIRLRLPWSVPQP